MTIPSITIHNLFSSAARPSLASNIVLPEPDKRALLGARTKIRDRLRRELQSQLRARTGDASLRIAPKFFTQGSWAYEMLIAPLRPPAQQADLDDGIYIPLSYVEKVGQPSLAAAMLLKAIEDILMRLANDEGWTLKTDNPNCTRVVLTKANEVPRMHIDVPAYAMPDVEYMQMVEARARVYKAERGDEFAEADDDLSIYPKNRVLLAHKTKGWRTSDPRPFQIWIEGQIKLKSEQLRRVIRFLKAWRDNQTWANSDPKSILLIVLADSALQQRFQDRDDLALYEVTKRIPNLLAGAVINPADPDGKDDLAARLDKDGSRHDVIAQVRRLNHVLEQALSGQRTDREIHELLRGEWGDRFPPHKPDEPRRVSDAVRSVAPARVPAVPPVGPRYSG